MQSVANGADASVGFRQSILLTSAKAFADTFFTSMSNGSNVSVAAQAGADCLIFTLDAAKDYAIAGNATVTINTSYSYPDNIVFSPQEIVSLQRELQNGYKAEQLRENVKRYYKLINGLISTSYYDVTFENDQIVSFISHLKNYTNILLPQDVYKQTSLPSQYIEDGIIYDSALANKKLYAYCKVGNFMVPVEIIYVSYISTNTGLATEAVICTNLNNGEILNYYDIAIEH